MTVAAPLLFLRHGETGWNALGRYQGATDTALSDIGKTRGAQHAGLVRRLCAEGQLDETRLSLTTSPLQRAAATAQALRLGLNNKPPLTTDTRLRELSFGRWEGLTSMDVKAQFYEERKSRKKDPYRFAPVGGDSMAARRSEVRQALEALAPHTIIVTHSGIIRLIAVMLNDDPNAVSIPVPHQGGFLWNGNQLSRIVMEP